MQTFESLVFGDHPLKDDGDDLSDGGGRRVVGDVVLGEVETEAQHDGLKTTRETLQRREICTSMRTPNQSYSTLALPGKVQAAFVALRIKLRNV